MITIFADSTRFDGNLAEATGPFVNPGTSGFTSVGCWADSGNPRTHSVGVNPITQTIASCLQTCQGYQYSDVECGGQCFCDNSLTSGSTSAPITDCSMPCYINSSECCGADYCLNLYSFGNGSTISPTTSTSQCDNPSNSIGFSTSTTSSSTSMASEPVAVQTAGAYIYADCHTNNVAVRALTAKSAAGSMMTIEYCASVCAGYTYMAAEYADECYCGNQLMGGNVTATDGRRNMGCAANSQELCGGPNGLSLYQLSSNTSSASNYSSSISISSSTSGLLTATTSSALSTFSTASNSTPTATEPSLFPNIGSYAYVDSHTDNNLGARALEAQSTTSNSMTVTTCAAFCAGYTYFGIEYAQECYCGNQLMSRSTTATDERCSMTCSGNSM